MDALKYHRSMLIGGAVRRGNGWVLGRISAFGAVEPKTIFLPASLDPATIQRRKDREAKKRCPV